MQILEDVYEDLTKFRDENNLPSYTEAIRYLLDLYSKVRATYFEWRKRFGITEFVGEPGRSGQEGFSSVSPSITVKT